MARPKKANPVEVLEPTPQRVERKKRVPLGRARNILTVNDMDPNYFYRWINDLEDRILRAKEGGYEVVNREHSVGDPVVDGSSTNKYGSAYAKRVSGSTWAVLMRIKREDYNADQKAKQDKILEQEKGLQQAGREEGRYGSVEITR